MMAATRLGEFVEMLHASNQINQRWLAKEMLSCRHSTSELRQVRLVARCVFLSIKGRLGYLIQPQADLELAGPPPRVGGA
jgi:hypothetical protein